MSKNFRNGNIGALMDEYEKAAEELKQLISTISPEEFNEILDANTADHDCHSMMTIMNHVIGAGYRYANQIRVFLKSEPFQNVFQIRSVQDSIEEFDKMLNFTIESIGGNWSIQYEEVEAMRIETRWGFYDIEIMLEHAIVHILRHRRQIERLKQKIA